MSATPCKDCPRRTVTCHGVCRDYQQWKQQHLQAVEQQRQRNIWPGTSRTAIRQRILQTIGAKKA